MKKEGGKSLSHAEGGAEKVLGGGREIIYPVLRGGAQKVSDPQFSHFVAHFSFQLSWKCPNSLLK